MADPTPTRRRPVWLPPALRPPRPPVGRLAALLLAGTCVLAGAGCGDVLQEHPVSHSSLEALVTSPFPVYWLGSNFAKLPLTEVVHDASGAVSLIYGNCQEGGEGSCVPPLRLVSSPDNSFLPGGATAAGHRRVRGLAAAIVREGRTIELATGPVVVDVIANRSTLAREAARAMVPIGEVASIGQHLPKALPDSGYAQQPLAIQRPSQIAPLSP